MTKKLYLCQNYFLLQSITPCFLLQLIVQTGRIIRNTKNPVKGGIATSPLTGKKTGA